MVRIILVFIKQRECTFLLYISTVFMLTHLPKARTTKTGFGQVKIKKEFVYLIDVRVVLLVCKQYDCLFG
jgi:hypothetical protein